VHEQEKAATAQHAAVAALATQRKSDMHVAQQKRASAHAAFTQASEAFQLAQGSMQHAQHAMHEALESGQQCRDRIDACRHQVMGSLEQIREECRVVLREIECRHKVEGTMVYYM
jgi:hypothetical protein